MYCHIQNKTPATSFFLYLQHYSYVEKKILSEVVVFFNLSLEYKTSMADYVLNVFQGFEARPPLNDFKQPVFFKILFLHP